MSRVRVVNMQLQRVLRSWGALTLTLALTLALALLCAPTAAQAQTVCATAGNDGPNAALSGVVNTYYPGVGTANAGATTVTLGTSTGAVTPIAAGDLVLIIQMQGATIDTRNTGNYGDGVAADPASGALTGATFTAGQYEYAVAVNFVGATLTIRSTGTGNGLRNTYRTAAWGATTQGQQTFQVVRVPQYSSATVTGTLTARAWDGATGGIVAVDVAGALTINGTVNTDAQGFRGGGGRGTAGGGTGAGTPRNTDYMLPTSWNLNGQKGEGIAGTPRYVYNGTAVLDTGVEGYPGNATFTAGASTGSGAPGNAGGGGTDGNPTTNEENPGGGGGGNGGAGGRGGLTWRTRLNIGGFGGLMSVAPSNTRVVMGGGGGAGSRNNSSGVASSGAVGGGIVMLRAGTIAGTGTISANGADAFSGTLNDGAGGGGAGGSILINASNTPAIALNARGGRGGDAWTAQPVGTICGTTPCDTDNRHGPGGGGGGGYVATSWTGAANVAGGAHGITTTAGAPNNVYGSTDGSIGVSTTLPAANVPGANSGAQCVPQLTVTKTTSTPAVTNTQTGTNATYTITVANAANLSAATNVTLSDTLPALFTYASTGTITYTGSAARTTTTNPTAGAAVPAWSAFSIPGGGSVALTFTVSVDRTAVGTYQNPATASYTDPTRTTTNGTTSASYNSASSTGEDVTVAGLPTITLDKTCTSPANCMTPSATQAPGTELTYTITFNNTGNGNAASLTLYDMVPANTSFKVGSVSYSPGASGIPAPVVEYSQQPRSAAAPPVPPTPATWINYTPPGAAGTFDATVNWIRWTFASPIPPGKSASVSVTVRIN